MSGGEESTVVHAYGLVDARSSVQPPSGIGGASVFVVGVDDLGVLVSEVSADEYGEPVWLEHAEDPQWLGQVAAEHHAVLQALVERVDVLPLRLPGIHADPVALTKVLTAQYEQLRATFDAVRGHVELGAKAYVVESAEEAAVPERPKSGREYLARRSAEASKRDDARMRRQAEVLAAHEAMADASTHAVANPPQDPALSGRSEPMVLNGAYLVARDNFDTFVALVERLGHDLKAHGISLEVTGPWPPYNFAAGEAGYPDAAEATT